MTSIDRPLLGMALRLVATLLLAGMFSLAKLAQQRGANLVEIVFFRQAISVLPILALVLVGPGLASLRTARPWAHVTRTAVGTTGMTLNFATVGLLPLAETQALWFTTPLFATILSGLVFGERVGIHRWSAVVAGFIGVLLIVQPQASNLPLLGASIGIAAGLVTGCVSILLRQLGRTEPALTTVFWFGTLSALPLALIMPWFAQAHDGVTWAVIAALGGVGALAQLAFTWSLRLASVSVLAPIDYVSLIWSVMFGATLFGALPDPWTWVGAPIIVGSGLYIVWREARLRRSATAPIAE